MHAEYDKEVTMLESRLPIPGGRQYVMPAAAPGNPWLTVPRQATAICASIYRKSTAKRLPTMLPMSGWAQCHRKRPCGWRRYMLP